MNRQNLRTLALPGALLAFVLSLSACGGGGGGKAAPDDGGGGIIAPPPDGGGNGGGNGGGGDGGDGGGGPVDPGPVDPGPVDPGPVDPSAAWPVANVVYGTADGILERPVVGMTTDAAQNRWVATHTALYLLRPGETRFRRYTSADGLHLQDNPIAYCETYGLRECPAFGAAADPGISEIEGGGPGEVFVGYHGDDAGDGTSADPGRHSGKVDRVRLLPDGTLQVDRFDLVSVNHGLVFWHNRTVQRLLYDHRHHPGDLYVGTNHGVTLLRPDDYLPPASPSDWPDNTNRLYMGDHLHARVCFHAPCVPGGGGEESNQRMGDWRGLALDPDGHLWHAGRWTAGLIRWDPDVVSWFSKPGSQTFLAAFGDPYPAAPNAEGFRNEPVFRVPQEGDAVNLSAVAVAPDGRVWFASGYYHSDPGVDGLSYGLAVWNGRSFTTFDPADVLGFPDRKVRDLIALPDGRLAVAPFDGPLVIWNPATGETLRVPGRELPQGDVLRLELDDRVVPPALHVASTGGAAVLRVLP